MGKWNTIVNSQPHTLEHCPKKFGALAFSFQSIVPFKGEKYERMILAKPTLNAAFSFSTRPLANAGCVKTDGRVEFEGHLAETGQNGGGGGRVRVLIWPLAMYTGEYNLHVTRPSASLN